ncbi:yeats family-domain-containing protein [Dichotomocladium elegans]|nr:yeats family-domain-containing protein [Dichotomocladium elegans]
MPGSSSEASHYTRRSAAVVANAMFQTLLPSLTDSRKTDKSVYRGQGLYGRRSDGVFVRLSCPACKRDDFANQQGFLNHCRLAHNLEFGPYEQIMLRCGTPVDESEVPLDHPVRSRPVTRPVPPVRQKRKERPTIKVFEEDVDLESDRLPKQEHQEKASKIEKEDKTPDQHEMPQEQQPMESIAAAVNIPADNDHGSRFYIKRQIIVGNVSKYIPSEKRDPTLKNFTHKWMVYVVEPPQMQEISKFVTAVRFHLHPSYKPLDVVDVMEPPFRLTRLGWGEFPIRIQLFFVDKRRNKSVDIIHQVKLDYTHSGKQMPGGERVVEIELDRNTDFEDTSNVPRATKPNDTSTDDTETPSPTASILVKKQKMALLHGMLKEGVRWLPIIRPGNLPLVRSRGTTVS